MFRTIALTGIAALVAATTISLAPPAHAQIGNIFSDPAAAAAGRHPSRQPATARAATARRRRGSAGTAARPAAADPEPAAAGAGRAAAGSCPVAAAGAAARHDRRSAKYPAGHRGSAAAARPAGRRQRAAAGHALPGQRQPKGVPQAPATLQPGDEVVSEPPATEDHQQEGELLRPRQDHRPHHQFRRGYRRDRAVRRAARQNQRLLHEAVHRSRQHRRLCRGRRDHAAGRGEADLLGLDVCCKPRPAWRRAPGLRYLADRLQRPRPDHRQRGARTAEGGPAARAEAPAAAEAGGSAPAGDRRRSRNSSSSNLRRHPRRSNGPAACLADCSGS